MSRFRGRAESRSTAGPTSRAWLATTEAGAGWLEGLARVFFAKAEEAIATPWALAAASDFAFPKTIGERPPNAEEDARYFAALEALAAEDVEVHRLMTEVFGLAKPLSILSDEPLRNRVLELQRRQEGAVRNS